MLHWWQGAEAWLIQLTHWGQDKMDAISQTTLSNAFSWMKIFEFGLNFLKFVPEGPINNIPAFIQIMAWRRAGDKPLSEPMMVSLPTHICVTRPQWVNGLLLNGTSSHYPDSVLTNNNKNKNETWICNKNFHVFLCSGNFGRLDKYT